MGIDSATKATIKAKFNGGTVTRSALINVLQKQGMVGAESAPFVNSLDFSSGSMPVDDVIDSMYAGFTAFQSLSKKTAKDKADSGTKDLIKAKFKASDAGGQISKAELESVLKTLGMDGAELNSVFKNLDLSKGSVSIDDFIDWTYGDKSKTSAGKSASGPKENPSLGIIRLDYDYPPAPGDIDHPGSFAYDVHYRAVPGLTFSICQSGRMTPAVQKEFIEAIHWLEAKGCKGFTGDCGFMMWFQALARRHTKKPVFLSSLAHLPAVTCAFSKYEYIAIFTANGKTLEPMRNLIRDECGIDPDEQRYIFVGCEDVVGFEAVALGEKVDTVKVTPGIVKKVKDTLKIYPNIRAIMFECTELPPYSDAVRAATGLPVFDAITCCDFFYRSCIDNPRFGINDWQEEWDGKQEKYVFGQNLDAADRAKTQNLQNGEVPQREKAIVKPKAKPAGKKEIVPQTHDDGADHPSLGVIRLDYDYPPAPGDIDCPGSYAYDVYYRCVPGLTFSICQSGKLTPEIASEFIEAVKWLEAKGVKGITGDCGFMMWFQALARQHTHKPVFMSSLSQLPAITAAFGPEEHVAIFTANSKTLGPMRDLIRDECGIDTNEFRFIMVGCEEVPGFEAVALGEKVDVELVTPHIVAMAKKLLKEKPQIRAILLECTELPPYSDAIRNATGLPVFDAITGCDLFLNAQMDNPLFGLNNWQASWDGKQKEYKFGDNLDKGDLAKLVTDRS